MGFTDNVLDIAKTTKETVVSALEFGFASQDIRAVLKRDHMLVSGMIDSLLEKAEDSDPGIFDLMQSMRDELLLHAKSEEQVLYEACKRHGKDLRTFALEGFREHELVELLLNQLINERPGKDGQLKASLTVLKEILEHHVREEEGDLFPKLSAEFSKDQLLDMGEMMERAKDRITVPAAPAELPKPTAH